MKELHICLENYCTINPLYYKVTPDEFQQQIVDAYDRRELAVFGHGCGSKLNIVGRMSRIQGGNIWSPHVSFRFSQANRR